MIFRGGYTSTLNHVWLNMNELTILIPEVYSQLTHIYFDKYESTKDSLL